MRTSPLPMLSSHCLERQNNIKTQRAFGLEPETDHNKLVRDKHPMKRLAVFAVVVLLGTTIYAHHSHPDFLTDGEVTVAGTVERVEFKNPHVLVTLRTADATVYTLEWQGARWLRTNFQLVSPIEQSVEADTLTPGDRLIVAGSPARDPFRHELVVLKRVERPLDGWLWTCRRPEKHITC